jgi:hypothetical protein
MTIDSNTTESVTLLSSSSSSLPTCEICGWLAAAASALAFGSFGTFIKSARSQSVNVDPLVFQTYKTAMCFLTCWIVLSRETFCFSPWGIISGLFWVPGGVATVYAVKSAGLALGIGIGSSCIVLVSFTWGIFVFGEHVHSRIGACAAIGCLIAGVFGMSYFSRPTVASINAESGPDTSRQETRDTIVKTRDSASGRYTGITNRESEEDQDERIQKCGGLHMSLSDEDDEDTTHCIESNSDDDVMLAVEIHDATKIFSNISKRQAGILSAIFCGVWGGSIMAPMHFAPPDAKGTHFLISFALGSSLVTLALWIVRFAIGVVREGSAAVAYQTLPSFHFRVMWWPGGMSGLLCT